MICFLSEVSNAARCLEVQPTQGKKGINGGSGTKCHIDTKTHVSVICKYVVY